MSLTPRLGRYADTDSGDYWPGFVDALATLLLVVVFLLTIFVAGQFALGRALSGRDDRITALNAQLASLAEQLNLSRTEQARLETEMAGLQATIGALREEREELSDRIVVVLGQLSEAESRLIMEEEANQANIDQLALLNAQVQALRQQIAALNEALEASEAREAELDAQIVNLGQRLNAALASRVAELTAYRSDFFGRLRRILGNRADITIVGDRFVFESDVLFPVGSAALSNEGREGLRPVAEIILELAAEIPDDIDWVIQIDGHTDIRPIRTTYASNWHLSTARAISVINLFESLGVPSERMVAAGYGEHHPIATGTTEAAFARNRRIELKLTSR